MKNSTNQNRRSYTDLVSTNAAKSRRLSMLWLLLLTLLFVPTHVWGGGKIQQLIPAVIYSII